MEIPGELCSSCWQRIPSSSMEGPWLWPGLSPFLECRVLERPRMFWVSFKDFCQTEVVMLQESPCTSTEAQNPQCLWLNLFLYFVIELNGNAGGKELKLLRSVWFYNFYSFHTLVWSCPWPSPLMNVSFPFANHPFMNSPGRVGAFDATLCQGAASGTVPGFTRQN